MSRRLMIGRWFLAAHGVFTWRPRFDRNELAVWSVWWLWFEVTYCPPEGPSEIEEAAIQAVTSAISGSRCKASMLKAMSRISVKALALIGGPEEAFRHHLDGCKYYHERIWRGNR